MAYSISTNALITGSSVGYVYEVKTNAGTVGDVSPNQLWDFSELTESTVKPKIAAGSGGTTGETNDLTVFDGRVIQYPKESLNISGITEVISSTASGIPNASSKGEMTLTTRFTPVGSTYTTVTAWLAEIMAKKDSVFLIVLPTGYSGVQSGNGNTKKPDGWAYMLGALSADPEFKAGTDVALTFASVSSSKTLTVSSSFFTGKGVDVTRGKVSSGSSATVIDKTLNTPLALTTQDCAVLQAGEILLKPNP